MPDVIITTFGDMVRVPGSRSSLQQAKAEGADVRIVYSTQDALTIARDNPNKTVVFIGIGFETTAPTVAASILQAEQENLNNYYVLSLHKVLPADYESYPRPGRGENERHYLPGACQRHYRLKALGFIAKDYHIACAVSGFEPVDILLAVDRLVEQIESGEPKVEIAYRRGVKEEGNLTALRLMDSVFEIGEANWRGIGMVPGSGLNIREKYASSMLKRILILKPVLPASRRAVSAGRYYAASARPTTASFSVRPARRSTRWGPAWYHRREAALRITSTK